jgi:hypothetical protein
MRHMEDTETKKCNDCGDVVPIGSRWCSECDKLWCICTACHEETLIKDAIQCPGGHYVCNVCAHDEPSLITAALVLNKLKIVHIK